MLNKNIEYKNRDEISSQIKRNHLILFPDGKEINLNINEPKEVLRILKNIGNKELSSYIQSEEIKGQPKNEPPSIKEMCRLQLVDYEEGSDSGH